MSRRSWSREDIIIAYALYCVTPFNKINPKNEVIKQVAEQFDFSLSSLIMRMQNFRNIDSEGEDGLKNVAKLDKEIYQEFKHDWGALSFKAEELTGLALFDDTPLQGAKPLSSLTDRNRTKRERAFFRKAVLSSYDYKCCMSGLSVPNMLVASHIKPFNKCRTADKRMNPENGLCLNTFYDKAFDSGFITVLPNLSIKISTIAKTFEEDEFAKTWLLDLEGLKITTPTRFSPKREFLEYHNDVIFKG